MPIHCLCFHAACCFRMKDSKLGMFEAENPIRRSNRSAAKAQPRSRFHLALRNIRNNSDIYTSSGQRSLLNLSIPLFTLCAPSRRVLGFRICSGVSALFPHIQSSEALYPFASTYVPLCNHDILSCPTRHYYYSPRRRNHPTIIHHRIRQHPTTSLPSTLTLALILPTSLHRQRARHQLLTLLRLKSSRLLALPPVSPSLSPTTSPKPPSIPLTLILSTPLHRRRSRYNLPPPHPL